MAMFMKVNGLTTKLKVLEHIAMLMVLITKAIGLKISSMDMELRVGQMVHVTKVNTQKVRRRVMVVLLLLMEVIIKASSYRMK